MTEKKPTRRQRAIRAHRAILEKQRAARRKPPTAEMRVAYEFYAALYEAGCDDSDFGRLMTMMMPKALDEARVTADFALCMTMPREFPPMAEKLDMTVAELRRERDRALDRLEAAAHQLRLVE